MKLKNILLMSLSFALMIGCASKKKVSVKTLDLRLASDGFATISFNIIKISKTEEKDKFVVNGVLDYEAPGLLQIKLDKEKPMLVAIQDEVVKLTPIKNKYRYQPRKISEGQRVLHIQMNDYEVSEGILERITEARRVVVRLPASPHKEGGFDGVLRTAHKNKLIDFLE